MKFCPICKAPRFSFEMDVIPSKINQLNSLQPSPSMSRETHSREAYVIGDLRRLVETAKCTTCIPNLNRDFRYRLVGNAHDWVTEVQEIQEQAIIKRKEINTQFYHHAQNFLVLTCNAHPNWDYEVINMVSSAPENLIYNYDIRDCNLENNLCVTFLTMHKFKMIMQCIKMGGNALINTTMKVGGSTATAIKINPSSSFKLSDKGCGK